ncbi:MAG: DUF2917 domain-containing protein [Polaromonas sp.]|uniref:DUF2917 domain-containing protein n=1 Tax=Polaromonas sp. TaxID=1869339 RepID=UPI0025F8E129|nr:DUF2917 domain-containing protein [Polaromonas sp.]MBI2728178.1 DUF2917 domain-containing protein [Polaromonas sp.]
MHTPQTPLKLGLIPQALRLPRGQVLSCTAGCLWITSDALAGLRDSDVVLESGQSFVTPQASTYFVGAPRGCGVLDFSPAPQRTEATC